MKITPKFTNKDESMSEYRREEYPYLFLLHQIDSDSIKVGDSFTDLWITVWQVHYPKILKILLQEKPNFEENISFGGSEYIEFIKDINNNIWNLFSWRSEFELSGEPVLSLPHKDFIEMISNIIAGFARGVEELIDPESKLVIEIKETLKETFPEVHERYFGKNKIDIKELVIDN